LLAALQRKIAVHILRVFANLFGALLPRCEGVWLNFVVNTFFKIDTIKPYLTARQFDGYYRV